MHKYMFSYYQFKRKRCKKSILINCSNCKNLNIDIAPWILIRYWLFFIKISFIIGIIIIAIVVVYPSIYTDTINNNILFQLPLIAMCLKIIMKTKINNISSIPVRSSKVKPNISNWSLSVSIASTFMTFTLLLIVL